MKYDPLKDILPIATLVRSGGRPGHAGKHPRA